MKKYFTILIFPFLLSNCCRHKAGSNVNLYSGLTDWISYNESDTIIYKTISNKVDTLKAFKVETRMETGGNHECGESTYETKSASLKFLVDTNFRLTCFIRDRSFTLHIATESIVWDEHDKTLTQRGILTEHYNKLKVNNVEYTDVFKLKSENPNIIIDAYYARNVGLISFTTKDSLVWNKE